LLLAVATHLSQYEKHYNSLLLLPQAIKTKAKPYTPVSVPYSRLKCVSSVSWWLYCPLLPRMNEISVIIVPPYLFLLRQNPIKFTLTIFKFGSIKYTHTVVKWIILQMIHLLFNPWNELILFLNNATEILKFSGVRKSKRSPETTFIICMSHLQILHNKWLSG
jgi:hypothetical protein